MDNVQLEAERVEEATSDPCLEAEQKQKSATQIRRAETNRGFREAGAAIARLREKWPDAFPIDPRKVRPLALGVVEQVATEMGWSKSYTQGVMQVWKRKVPYCRAILSHFNRYALDGSVAEPIEVQARQLARESIVKMDLYRGEEASTPAMPVPTEPPVPAEPPASIVVEALTAAPKVAASKPAKAPIKAAKAAGAASKPQRSGAALSAVAAAKAAAAAAAAAEKDRAFRAKMAELVAKRRRAARK